MIRNVEIHTQIHNNVNSKYRLVAKVMPRILALTALVSVLVTLGIVVTLLSDAVRFFQAVSLTEIFGSELRPLSVEPIFGFLPIISGTFLTALIAIAVAFPIGLASAIYLSEFASDSTRRILKPLIEILAGIPTIVYGFFAYQVVTPLLMKIIPQLAPKNALSPGIVMGIMIVSMIASLSEDALRSVPNALREGALALGATHFEVASNVVLPAAISGVVASVVLAVSRAIGETMIVTIASGSAKRLTFDITQSMQTMTGYIVEFTSGDAASGTIGYHSLYAVGLLLFTFTLIMNLAAKHIARKYRKDY